MRRAILKAASVMIAVMLTISISAQQGMRLMNPMHETISELDQFSFTGDPDNDFANMMLIHHKGSIQILNEVLSQGTDEDVVELAKKIREGQEKDINELQKFTTESSTGEPNSEFIKEMKLHLENAKEEMSRNMQLSGNINKDFADLMSMHHEHGIEMARTELTYGKNQELKQLAGKMLEDQQRELEELENLKGSEGMGKMKHESIDSASSRR